jgi:hypothetical protein
MSDLNETNVLERDALDLARAPSWIGHSTGTVRATHPRRTAYHVSSACARISAAHITRP